MENTKNGPAAPDLFLFGMKTRYGGLLGGVRNRSLIISYLSLRRLIGWLGIFLPIICVLGGRVFSGLACQSSISFYYHANMRDFFIGILLTVSVFLITYKGEQTIDNVVTWVIGLAGIVVALFPTADPAGTETHVGLFQVRPELADAVHLTAAAIFFFLLALNSLFLFTISREESAPAGSRKPLRNLVYVACGVTILVCLAMFPVLGKAMGGAQFKAGPLVLVLESVMLLAFGISWLVKGEAILGDARKNVGQTLVKE